jgi:flagellar hook-associated protein 2
MAISSTGIGSGLDVSSIVTQLMALEKKPLEQLQSKASGLQTQLSAFGQLKSQVANLQDQIGKLTATSTWSQMLASSSNSAAVMATASDKAAAGSLSVSVSQLATAQATASGIVASGTSLEGTLTFDLGKWTGSTFAATAGSTPVSVSIASTDTLAMVADKINTKNAGVTASVMTDASGSRLLLRSSNTGAQAGFRVQASNLGVGSALAGLAYDPQNASVGTSLTQAGLDTQASINGVAVTSTNNQFNDVITGVKITASQVTTSAATITLSRDTNGVKTAINNMVESYNALSKALAEMTKYDPATKTAGSLQGDGLAVGLENALRRTLSGLGASNGTFKRLSDVGVAFQSDGTLSVDNTKLTKALQSVDDLKTFFTATPTGAQQTQGLAVQLKTYTQGLLDSTSGSLTYKNKALKTAIDRNTKEQDRMNDRLTRTEQRLNAQYSRLDSSMASLNALSAYVTQQVTSWNNQKSG